MGIFKCGDHNFTCDSIAEWRSHAEEFEHTYVGNTDCLNCDTNIKLDHKLKVKKENPAPKLLCEECKTA